MKRLKKYVCFYIVFLTFLNTLSVFTVLGASMPPQDEWTIIYPIENLEKNPYICIANKATYLWVGDTFRFTIVANRLPDAEIEWSVSNPAVAEINSITGELSLKQKGTVTVYAKEKQSGKSSYCKVTVLTEDSSYPELPREWYETESFYSYDYGEGMEETVRLLFRDEYKEEMQQCRAIAFPDTVEGKKVSYFDERYNEFFSELEYIKFPKYLLSCYKITAQNAKEVILPEFLSELPTYFAGKNLEMIHLKNNLQIIDYYAFQDCTGLKEIVIPSSVKAIDLTGEVDNNYTTVFWRNGQSELGIHVDGNNKNYYSVFGVLYSNNKLIRYSPELDSSVYVLYQWKKNDDINQYKITEINYNAFFNAVHLKWIKLPDEITRIEDNAFKKCSNLKKITLPSELKYLGDLAFAGCLQLRDIIIPDGVREIGSCCFANCPKLNTLYIPESVTKIGVDILGKWYKKQITIITPKGSYAEKYAIKNGIPYRNE